MSVPPEALQKMLLEMDNQLNKSQAELSMVNLQLDKVNTNLAMIDSTKKSLAKYTVPNETVWKGIGKAFVATEVGGYLQEMANDGKQFEETKSGLNKKKTYLETTLTNTINAMSQIVEKK
jgi:prefoldin subunit 1